MLLLDMRNQGAAVNVTIRLSEADDEGRERFEPRKAPITAQRIKTTTAQRKTTTPEKEGSAEESSGRALSKLERKVLRHSVSQAKGLGLCKKMMVDSI